MKKIIRKACATVALLATCAAATLTLSSCGGDFDYLTSELGGYVYIAESDYKNYTVDIPFVEVGDGDIARAINKLLVANKSEEAKYNGGSIVSLPLTLGDVASIRYRGYTVDENGLQVELENASNLDEDTESTLEIGSGAFISGFEEGLLGVVPKNVAKFEKITTGNVKEGDVIYVSYDVFKSDGTVRSAEAERVDLANPATDKVYGNGFSAFFAGREIGKKISEQAILRVEGDSIDTTYYNIKVEAVTRCESGAVKVQAYFPADYSTEELRGLEVTFDVYVASAVIYDTPEWNDEFITETLKVTAEELADYDGETLTEKYEAKLRNELIEEAEETNNDLIEEKMWEIYHEKAEIKKLPEKRVDEVYDEYYTELLNQYSVYGAYYSELDDFAAAYFGLSSGADWKAYMRSRAENVVSEQLIFYYIIRTEGLIPSDEEFKKIYDENIDDYMEYYEELYKDELDACESDEERDAKLAEIKSDMLEYYGEAYFTENVYYQFAIKTLVGYADVKKD